MDTLYRASLNSNRLDKESIGVYCRVSFNGAIVFRIVFSRVNMITECTVLRVFNDRSESWL
jgi:hypothetical protein